MAKRVDDNQAEIVAALRAIGCTVESLHAVGRGVPDLLVGYRGENLLLEVKGAAGSLTPEQRAWHPHWRGQVVVVHSIEEALKAVGCG